MPQWERELVLLCRMKIASSHFHAAKKEKPILLALVGVMGLTVPAQGSHEKSGSLLATPKSQRGRYLPAHPREQRSISPKLTQKESSWIFKRKGCPHHALRQRRVQRGETKSTATSSIRAGGLQGWGRATARGRKYQRAQKPGRG